MTARSIALSFALVAPAAAQQFTDYAWTTGGCVSVTPATLSFSTCGEAGCPAGEHSFGSFTAPVSGSFEMDFSYTVFSTNPFTQLVIYVGDTLVFEQGGFTAASWCTPGPCGGGEFVQFHVTAGQTVFFVLDSSEKGCKEVKGPTGCGGTTGVFTGLNFAQDPAIVPTWGMLNGSFGKQHTGVQPLAQFGQAVLLVGDLDGDSLADSAAGAPWEQPQGGAVQAGVVHVRDAQGGSLGKLGGPHSGSGFGAALARAGDMDGDGVTDFIVGAPAGTQWGSSTDNRVFVYEGDGLGPHLSVIGPPNSSYGQSVDGGADVNGDGVPDLLVGSPREDVPVLVDAGRARVLDGTNGAQLRRFDGTAAGQQLGWSVAFAGDLNLDGLPDVILGAPGDASLGPDTGRVRAHSALSGALHFTLFGEDALHRFGTAVAGPGDLNGDGRADLVASSPDSTTSAVEAGRVRAFSGNLGAPLWAADGVESDHLGSCLAAAADLDGDGRRDILAGAVGAPAGDLPYGGPPTEPTGGRALLLSGATGAQLFALGPLANTWSLATSVSAGPALDATGDGVPDLLAGAPFASTNLVVFGSSILFHGAPAHHVQVSLAGNGTLQAGTPVTFTFAGPPSAVATLILGLSQPMLPFKGGLLVPTADAIVPALPLNAQGALTLPATWPAGLPPGLVITLQAWMPSAVGPKGFVATNGLELQTP
jgi:FG-GAP-like repeat/FG-GAP repeat